MVNLALIAIPVSDCSRPHVVRACQRDRFDTFFEMPTLRKTAIDFALDGCDQSAPKVKGYFFGENHRFLALESQVHSLLDGEF
jgi:hypothetical protein